MRYTPRLAAGFLIESLGRERAQFANVVLAQPVAALSALFGIPFAGAQGFLSGARTVDIGATATGAGCSAASQVKFDNGDSVVGSGSPASCLPVALRPSGMNTISAVVVSGRINTGRLFLRFPYAADAQGQSTGEPQEGYIVPKCEGSTPQGQAYDYEPCFVANLRLTISGPDGAVFGGGTPITGTTNSVRVPQQDVNVQVFGPVTFEQNGRLVISTKNANRFLLISYIGGSDGTYTPQPVPTDPGQQALQLVGAPIHGGRAFPTR
jgi:hypothetical protein